MLSAISSGHALPVPSLASAQHILETLSGLNTSSVPRHAAAGELDLKRYLIIVLIGLSVGCSSGEHDPLPLADATADLADEIGEDAANESTDTLGDVGPEDVLSNGLNTLDHEGLSRSYLLYQPENAEPGAALVVALHGYTGSAAQIQTYSGMNRVADEHGFVVVYPMGTVDSDGEPFFNVGYAFHTDVTVNDVGFIRALVATLVSSLDIDSERVFATGLSNGGEMSYMLACEATDTFRAIASVAGVMFRSFSDDCSPSRELSVLEIHGTDDAVNWYGGDQLNDGGWGAYLAVEDAIQFWREFNGLDEHETTELADVDLNDGSDVVWERYWSNLTTTEVWLYRVVGGDHDWPGAWGNMDFQTSEVVWSFFSRTMDN